MTMYGSESIYLPGEHLSLHKPWLRKVGNQVIRYVRGSIEDPGITLLRTIGGDALQPQLQKGLERKKSQMEQAIEHLRSLGVSVVKNEITIDEIPYFDSDHRPSATVLGMQIVADYVDGKSLDRVPDENRDQQKIQQLYEGLTEYAHSSVASSDPFLCDITEPEQFMVREELESGQQEIVLVDLDPLFSEPFAYFADFFVEQLNENIKPV